mgnify:CR=1 FL=1
MPLRTLESIRKKYEDSHLLEQQAQRRPGTPHT